MIGYRRDDGGRAASGRRGSARDCVARAAAILHRDRYRISPQKAYEEVYAIVADEQARLGKARSARNGVFTKASNRAFERLGLRKVQLPRGPRLTFSEAHAAYGDCICTTAKHVAAVVAGALRDTFDCRTYEWEGEVRERKAMSVWVFDDSTIR